jgi:nucleoside-diphosphate-sugar epimerase
MRALGWQPRTDLPSGIALAYQDYLARYGGPNIVV